MDANDLYGLPLGEFTAARDKLAKEQQDPEIKRLKKPSVPAWAINQLARRERKQMGQLLRSGEALRNAHAGLGKRGGRDKLQTAADNEREHVARLVELAKPLLEEAGTASAANVERVRGTLHAAAADDELRAEIAAGRVVQDREAVGLGPLGLATGGVTAGKEEQRAAAQRRELREARSRAERAAKQLRAAEAALNRARRDAEEAERTLRDRQRALDQAQRDADVADAALSRAEDA